MCMTAEAKSSTVPVITGEQDPHVLEMWDSPVAPQQSSNFSESLTYMLCMPRNGQQLHPPYSDTAWQRMWETQRQGTLVVQISLTLFSNVMKDMMEIKMSHTFNVRNSEHLERMVWILSRVSILSTLVFISHHHSSQLYRPDTFWLYSLSLLIYTAEMNQYMESLLILSLLFSPKGPKRRHFCTRPVMNIKYTPGGTEGMQQLHKSNIVEIANAFIHLSTQF